MIPIIGLKKGIISINWLNVASIFFYLAIVSLFFPVKYSQLSVHSLYTGIYSDFLSYLFYLSDIFLIIVFLSTFLPRGVYKYHVVKYGHVALLGGYLLIRAVFGANELTPYLTGIFLLNLVSYEATKILFATAGKRALLYKVIGLCTGLVLILQLVQFGHQGPVGLSRLGETDINPVNKGIAKVSLPEGVISRPYALFPHPNVAVPFILLALLVIPSYLSLCSRCPQRKHRGNS
jgi:hypothetical protein